MYGNVNKKTYLYNIKYKSMLDRKRLLMSGDNVIDLSLVDINGNYTAVRETANCYVVKQPGKYKFPLVYGCGIKNSSKNPESYKAISSWISVHYSYCELLSQDNPVIYDYSYGQVIQYDTTGYLIENITIEEGTGDLYNDSHPWGYLKFTVSQLPSLGGNAIIAVKNSNGEILWSWHIWAYPFDLIPRPVETFRNFLNVNIGFVKNSANSKYGTCPYYQWGRKDPLLRSGATSGTLTIATAATSYWESVKNPTTFYKRHQNQGNNNWYIGVLAANYWNRNYYAGMTEYNRNGTKTIFDPSPPGFIVPCVKQLNVFVGNAGSKYQWDQGGTFNFYGNEFYVPACGFMEQDSGSISFSGTYAFLYSSSNYNGAKNLQITTGSSYNTSTIYGPSYAFPVRPVYEHFYGTEEEDTLFIERFKNLDAMTQEEAIETFNFYFGDFTEGEWEGDSNAIMRQAINRFWSFSYCSTFYLLERDFAFDGEQYYLWEQYGATDETVYILTDNLDEIKKHFKDFICNNPAKRYCPIHYVLNVDYEIMYEDGDPHSLHRVKYGTWDDTYEGLAVYSYGHTKNEVSYND